MNLELSESQLTEIIKEAFDHYKGKPFGRAIYVQKENGIEVQFVDIGVDDIPAYRHESMESKRRTEPDQPMPTFTIPNFITQNDPFGGFGGGSSGGAGASGGW